MSKEREREREKEKEKIILKSSKQNDNINGSNNQPKLKTELVTTTNQKKTKEGTPIIIDTSLRKSNENVIIKVHKTTLREKTPLEAIKSLLYLPFTFVQIGILIWILGFNYQGLISKYTYFNGGATDCALYYDTFNFSRWYYFIFAFNIIDVGISFYFEESSLYFLTFYSNIIAFVVNFILLITGLIVFLPNANKIGISGSGNIAQDDRFCGFLININNVNTKCQQFNPSMIPLCDSLSNTTSIPITTSNLSYNSNFISIACALSVLIVFGILKIFCARETKALAEKVGKKYIKDIDPLKLSGISKRSGASALAKLKLANAVPPLDDNTVTENDISYFTFITDSYILAYVPIGIFDFMTGFLLVVWLGWFQQNTNTITPTFKVDSSFIIGCTKLVSEPSSVVNYIFYGLVAFLIPIWCINKKLLSLYRNKYAILSSGVGICISFSILVWMIIDSFGCNGNGNGTNICNSKLFCAAFDLIGPFFLNPSNRCTNVFSCPRMVPNKELTPNTDYFVLLACVIAWLIDNIAVFTYGILVEKPLAIHREYEPKRVKLI